VTQDERTPPHFPMLLAFAGVSASCFLGAGYACRRTWAIHRVEEISPPMLRLVADLAKTQSMLASQQQLIREYLTSLENLGR